MWPKITLFFPLTILWLRNLGPAAGHFSLGFPHEVLVSCWLPLQSSKSQLKWRFKVAYRQDWLLIAYSLQGAQLAFDQSACRWLLQSGGLKLLHIYWLLPDLSCWRAEAGQPFLSWPWKLHCVTNRLHFISWQLSRWVQIQ